MTLFAINFLNTFAYDPLEQFSFANFFTADLAVAPKLWLLESGCPFDVIRWVVNLIIILDFAVRMIIFGGHYYVTSFVGAPVSLLIFWIISFNLIFALSVGVHKRSVLYTMTAKFILRAKINAGRKTPLNFLIWFLNASQGLVKSVLKSNTALERKEYFAVLYVLFIFIVLCNVTGLVPYSFTLTSSFVVTFFLAATHFIGLNIIAWYKNGWHFFNMFLPSGVPLLISPFLVLIELVSYIAKVFSLSIRLFANMMAGHALLKILIGFSWAMLATGIGIIGAFFPWVIVTAIIFLEILIAFLQAYVFIVLVAIYINDVLSSH